MKEKRGLALFCLIFIVLSAAFVSASFDVQLVPLTYEITPNDQAVYQVSITNNEAFADSFHLSVPDLSWTVLSKPLYDYFSSMDVPAKETRSTLLYISSTGKMSYGQYKTELTVKSTKTGVAESQYIVISLRSPNPVIKEYLAAVNKIVEIPSEVDPRETFPVLVNLDNRNPKNITELIIDMTSQLINKRISVSLGPLEKKTIRFDVKLDDFTLPQEDTLAVALIIDNQTLDPVIKELYAVKAYSNVRVEELPAEKAFLKVTRKITYANDGNVKTAYTAEQKVGFFERLFVSSSLKPYVVSKPEGQFLAWDLSLEPRDTLTITLVYNYLGLFIVVAILVIILAFYYGFRSPVQITKEAVVLETREGGVSEIKVLLQIKNRSDKSFDKVLVVDRISKIGEFSKQSDIGTIKPSQLLSHESEGTLVKWELGNLDRFEERIISYRIRSKLTVIGSFYLPPATIRYMTSQGRHRMVKSNSSRVTV